jgi:hypothetical protein
LRSEHPVASPRIVQSRFGPSLRGKGQMPIKMRRSLLTFIDRYSELGYVRRARGRRMLAVKIYSIYI